MASFFICLVAISVLTLLGLAMSALVRWRIVAGALILAVFAIGKGFAAMIDNVMRTQSGHYIDLQYLIARVSDGSVPCPDPERRRYAGIRRVDRI